VSVHWIDRGATSPTVQGSSSVIPARFGHSSIHSGTPRLPKADYIGYLRALEELLILALAQFAVQGQCVEGKTGVWVKRGDRIVKLASIGVKVDARGITRHGFALNVDPDMSYWQGIVACGLPDDQMTSLAALLPSAPSMQQVCQAVIAAFGDRFHYRMVKYP
jgi:lipoate-protein ligase B